MLANTSLSDRTRTPQCRCSTRAVNPGAERRIPARAAVAICACAGIDERLNLDEHRPRPLTRHERHAARNGGTVARQEDRRRILDFAESFLRHDEEPHLVRGAEPILDGAHDSEAAAHVAFEIEHGVDHVLEHARSRERAFLRDVARSSSVATCATFANRMSCAAHSRTWLTEPGADCSSSLNRVWIESIASTPSLVAAPSRAKDRLDARFGEHVERRVPYAEPLRAQTDLIERLLAGDVARRAVRCQIRERAQQQRRLADAGVTAEQHDAARNQPAAEHSIELTEPGRDARDCGSRRCDPAA